MILREAKLYKEQGKFDLERSLLKECLPKLEKQLAPIHPRRILEIEMRLECKDS